MTWIYPEQLFMKLQTKLTSVYVLFGNDAYMFKISQFNIIKTAKILNLCEHIDIELDIYYDWNKIFNLCKTPDLFKQRKILSLRFSQNYPFTSFNKNILLLLSLIHKDILLILYIYISTYITKSNVCLPALKKIGTFVICTTLKYTQLIKWVMNQAEYMQISIEKLACQLLCFYYENNLILLTQILKILSLIYPDKHLSFIHVKKIVTDSAYFNVNHWIEAILIGKKQRANRILRHLECTGINLEILLQKIQHEIFILINIKYKLTSKIFLYTLLKQYKIYDQHHQILLIKAEKRLRIHQLYRSLALLVHIELKYKTKYNDISRKNLELLTIILCSN